MAVRQSALSAGRALTPGRFLVLISVRGWADPRATVRLEGLGQLKKKIHLIGTQTSDLPACSIVPQPNTLPRAPLMLSTMFISIQTLCEKILLKILLFFSILQYDVDLVLFYSCTNLSWKWINNIHEQSYFRNIFPINNWFLCAFIAYTNSLLQN
jgi:hypothetical protein